MTTNSPEPEENLPQVPAEDIPEVPVDPDHLEPDVPAEPEVLAEEGAPDSGGPQSGGPQPGNPISSSSAAEDEGLPPEPAPTQEAGPVPIPEHLLSDEERAARAQPEPTVAPPPPISTPEPAVQHTPVPASEHSEVPATEHSPAPAPEHSAASAVETTPEPAPSHAARSAEPVEEIDDTALSQERARRFGIGRTEEVSSPPAPGSTAADSTQILNPPAQPVPAGFPAAASPPPAAQEYSQAPTAQYPATGETASRPSADLFAGLEDMPASRAAAHWWVILATLIFTPVAWFLISDGGERFAHTLNTSNAVSVSALVQLVGGVIALFVVFLAARWSSVGPIIIGSVGVLLGGAFVAIPELTLETLAENHHVFARLGQFGQTIIEQITIDGTTGRLLAYGVVLVMTGIVSHGARRQGRREERRRIALEL